MLDLNNYETGIQSADGKKHQTAMKYLEGVY